MKNFDLTRYLKKPKQDTLIDKHSVPITGNQKARLRLVKDRIDINKALRERLDEILNQFDK